MTSEPAHKNPAAGVLVLVVGASGVGKDTLLDAARSRLAGHANVCFPKRIITRRDKSGEDHIAVSEAAFESLKERHGLFLHWRAHDLSYGIPAEIETQLAAGKVVVVNTSRRIIDQARARWSRVKVINITTRHDVLRARLVRRGRENAAEIEKRFARATLIDVPKDENTVSIDNSGDLDVAIETFITTITSYAASG